MYMHFKAFSEKNVFVARALSGLRCGGA